MLDMAQKWQAFDENKTCRNAGNPVAQLMKKSQDCADPPSGIKRQQLVVNKIYAIINIHSASAKISLLITGAQYNDEKTLRSSAVQRSRFAFRLQQAAGSGFFRRMGSGESGWRQ